MMETLPYQNTLRQVPLFSGLNSIDLERVSRLVMKRKFHKGHIIFSEGQVIEGFYIVISGHIKIYKLSEDGKEQIVHIIAPGGTFAEAAVFTDGIAPAYAAALTECELFFVFNDDLIRLIKDNPQLALNMLASMSKYLRTLVTVIDELSLKEVSARLGKYLLDLSLMSGRGRFVSEIKLPITKKELAARLGTISETLSRTFNKLRAKRVIKITGSKIIIVDRAHLQEIAAGVKI